MTHRANRQKRFWRCSTAIAAVAIVGGMPESVSAQSTPRIEISAQPLAQALMQLSRQANVDIVAPTNLTQGLTAHPVTGVTSVERALDEMLANSGLHYRRTSGGYVIEGAPQGNAVAGGPNAGEKNAASSLGEAAAGRGNQAAEQQAIVVTGSHLGGQPIGSSVKTYTQEQFARSGASTLGQFARQIPENYSNLDSIANTTSNVRLSSLGVGLGSFENTSFNIHGLGPSATLTLLNGQRLAQGGTHSTFVDTSLIPLSAIERIEVLTDGASAIYGSDAVAGVVNLITRKDYDGAESSVRYGGATEGGATDLSAYQLLGKTWSSGNILLDFDYHKAGGLDASQRSYFPAQVGPYSVIAPQHTFSAFGSFNQKIDSNTNLSGDLLYGKRHFSDAYSTSGASTSISNAEGRAKQTGGTVQIDRAIGSWHASLSGNFSSVDQLINANATTTFGTRTSSTNQLNTTNSKTYGVSGGVRGALLHLPGGDVLAAFGAEYRHETFRSSFVTRTGGVIATSQIIPNATRDVRSAYGELSIPLVGEGNSLPLIQHLSLSAAARIDDYSDFGSATVPKLGVEWTVVKGLDLRGTWGQSFRAPELYEFDQPLIAVALRETDSASATHLTPTLFLQGGNASLRPETSNNYTLGASIHPDAIPGLFTSLSYFNVAYRNRISAPVGSHGALIDLADPALAPYVDRNPPLATVQGYFTGPGFLGDFSGLGAAGIQAIFDQRLTNIASTKQSGVDLSARYGRRTAYGHFDLSAALTRYFTNTVQNNPAISPLDLLNVYGAPTKWKGHGTFEWDQSGFAGALTMNYVNSYRNTLTAPPQTIGSWTTFDVYLRYAVPNSSRSFLAGTSFSLNIINAGDAKPPYVLIPASINNGAVNGLPFDPTNASPIGRFISFQLTKDW